MSIWRNTIRKLSIIVGESFLNRSHFTFNEFNMQLSRYIFVGGSSAFLEWFIYWVFINWFEMHYLIAGLFSFILATLVNYFLSIKWVFKKGIRFGQTAEITLVFGLSAVGLFINQFFLSLLIEVIQLHYMAAKILASGVVFSWNFLIRKHLIFKK